MRHSQIAAAPHRARHLVFGSGGTRAFLNAAGANFACHLAGIRTWETVGGVSGGSITALLVAAGIPANEIVRHAVAIDFSDLLSQTDTFGNMLRRRLIRRDKRFRHGIVTSLGLGTHLESVVTRWPRNFWTMAVSGKSQFVFTADGVFLYRKGRCRRLTAKPAPVGLAIRASCAVPGIIEAIEWQGHVLFDGALSRYGHCPTEMAAQHFGARTSEIVAVDLVRGQKTRSERFIELFARALSGTVRQRPSTFVPPAGLVVRTNMDAFPSLDFKISTDRKQHGVLAGFRTAVTELMNCGILSEQRASDLLARSETWAQFEQVLAESEQAPTQSKPVPCPARRRRWYYLWLR